MRSDWPYVVSLGRPSKKEILEGFSDIDALVRVLAHWERDLGVGVAYATREAGGSQRLPVRLTVPTSDVAATLAAARDGERWTTVLARTRERHEALVTGFPLLSPEVRAKVLRQTDGWDDTRFELLLASGSWFGSHVATGLTPREVPLVGIDAKWLDTARVRSLVCLLAGREELGLIGRPRQLEFAYLDPTYLAGGGRRYDSYVEGDVSVLPYAPDLVVIVENKDTYLRFPAVERGVCVFGSGRAGMAVVTGLPWVLDAQRVVYWGDLDADGFEILDGYRAHGLACESILMDCQTLERYGRFGTSLERDHRTRIVRERKELPWLTDEERACYERITREGYEGHVRLEQERIPYADALQALCGPL